MSAHTITLHLPALLYQYLRARAEEAHRSLEAELLEVVATAIPAAEELSPELSEAVSSLTVLADDELLRVTGSKMPSESAARLEELHWQRQRTGLTESESSELSHLMHLYEKTMLVRAQAALLLKQRGHEIAPTAFTAE